MLAGLAQNPVSTRNVSIEASVKTRALLDCADRALDATTVRWTATTVLLATKGVKSLSALHCEQQCLGPLPPLASLLNSSQRLGQFLRRTMVEKRHPHHFPPIIRSLTENFSRNEQN